MGTIYGLNSSIIDVTINYEEFFSFIEKSTNSYWAVKNAIDSLKQKFGESNVIELEETAYWKIRMRKLNSDTVYYVKRDDSSIIVFKIGKNVKLNQDRYNSLDTSFKIIATHGDSPSFKIKVNPELKTEGYTKFNVEPYGGAIFYSWFDKPLGVAGRIFTEDGEGLISNCLIDQLYNPIIIPSQAIHINPEVNFDNKINPQVDMLPIVTAYDDLEVTLESYLGLDEGTLLSHDLYLYNMEKPRFCGLENEFILSPRLDDLACVYTGLKAFENIPNEDSINVFCIFNKEEVGNRSYEGAGGSFLSDTLERICEVIGADKYRSYAKSFYVSADNAHAIHPNAPQKSDLTSKVKLGSGVVIKYHTNYITNSSSSMIFKSICSSLNIDYQEFTVRSDKKSGGTLGVDGVLKTGINGIDIGIPQLSMHSSTETISKEDLDNMFQAMQAVYQYYFTE